MATDLKSHAKDVSLTRFFGGEDKGSCVQVTTKTDANQFQYVSLTRAQAAALAADLLDFAQGRETEDFG